MAGLDSPHDAIDGPEATPSRLPAGRVTAAQVSGAAGPVLVTAPNEPGHIASTDVRVPLAVRLRSAALLAVSVLGTAILVGVVLSIIVVGAIILVA